MLPLSPIETKFLKLYDEGKSYKEICAALDISLSTAKTHARRILLKSIATCLRHAAYKRRNEPTAGRPALKQLFALGAVTQIQRAI